MVKKVRSPKEIARIKSPKYSKFPISIKRVTPRGMIKREIKKIGAFNIPSAVWRAGHPKPTRKPMPETLIRRGINVPKAILKFRQKVVDSQKIMHRAEMSSVFKPQDYNLIDLEVSAYGIGKLEELLSKNKIFYSVAMFKIASHLRRLWTEVYREYNHRQYVKVARDTGALRTSLSKSLGDTRSVIPPLIPHYIKDLALRMGFNSDLPYAQYISKGQVQAGQTGHSGKFIKLKHAGKMSRRTGRALNDPLAEKFILNYNRSTILKDLRRVIRPRLRQLFNYTAAEFKISQRQARAFYLIKHLRGRL